MFAVFAGISIREFARREGCSDTLVRRAIKQEKLRISAENLLDPAQVGSGWKKSNRKAANSANTGANTAPNVRTLPVRTRRAATPTPEEVDEASEEMFSEEVSAFLDNIMAGQFADQATAERIKENALAAKHLLAARHAAGHLVEIEQAETVLFETQRGQRDAWINFPSRVGPLLAAELGVDADKVVEALNVHVHQQLADLGSPQADFTAKREG